MDVLHIEQLLYNQICLFSVRRGCEIHLVSYGSKYTSQCPFDKPFVLTYIHNLKTTGCIRMSCKSNECSSIGDIPNVVRSRMKVQTGKLRPHTCMVHSLLPNCVCIMQACTHIAIWYTAMHDNKTHTPYHCRLYTPNDDLTANDV